MSKRISVLIILAILTGCSPGVNTPLPDIKTSSKPVVTASSAPKPVESAIPGMIEPIKDGVGKIQQSGDASNASPVPSVTPTPEETSSSSSSNPAPIPSGPCPPECGGGTIINLNSPRPSTSPTGPRFDNVNPVAEGSRTASMSVFFKDPAKIRYKEDLKEFISLVDTDVTYINKLIKQYNISVLVFDDAKGKTEAELEEEEKKEEALSGLDRPNKASRYGLSTETPINVKEFIEAFRLDPSVLSANEDKPVYSS